VVDVHAPDDALGEPMRRPVDLSVVLDTSGSMRNGKLDAAKRATRHLARSMGPDDTFGLVVFSDRARSVVAQGPVDLLELDRTLDRVWDHGGTDLHQGIRTGSDRLRARPDAVARVVVLSDGEPTAGRLHPDDFEQLARDIAADGASITTVGLGLDYNEDLLATIADVGGGDYAFVDQSADLTQVFDRTLRDTASVVAQGTSLRLTLPEGVQAEQVIGWDAQRHADGFTVYLGDLAAGQTRRILASLRVDGTVPQGEHPLVASADYIDLATGHAARDTDAPKLQLTADGDAVHRSLDQALHAQALRSVGNWHLEQSTRTYARGDREQARTLLQKSRDVLRDAAPYAPAAQLDLKAVDATAAAIEQHAPAAPEGRALIKGNKERFRAVTR
jgi:Ca-activated chloride channel family protein